MVSIGNFSGCDVISPTFARNLKSVEGATKASEHVKVVTDNFETELITGCYS